MSTTGERALASLGLAFALSPAIAEYARSLPNAAFAPCYLAAPVLLGLVAWNERHRPAHPRRALGATVVAAALILELLGIAGATASAMRLALPVGIAGLSLLLGKPRLMVAALAFWLVPIPSTFYNATTPHAEIAYARAAAALLPGVGAAGPRLLAGDQSLHLVPDYSGVHLAALLAMLTWLEGLRRGRSARASARRAAGACVLAIPGQAAAVVVAGALLAVGPKPIAEGWLDSGLWMAVLAGGLWLCFRGDGAMGRQLGHPPAEPA